jgi:hypothetical protein
MTLRQPVLYPFLIATYPVAALYAQNVSTTPWTELVLPVVLVTAAAVVVWLVIWLVVRDAARAGMLSVLALVVFDTITLATGRLNEFLTWVSGVWVTIDVHLWPPLVMGAELMLAAVVAYFVMRVKEPRAWTTGLNIFALILIALPTFSAVKRWTQHPGELTQHVSDTDAPPGAVAGAHRMGRLPDVYYIILDGYARADVMSELFNLDIEPFLKRLESKGFYVARRSTANYCQTPLSLSSSLNTVYLNGLIPSDWQTIVPLNGWTGDKGVVARTLGGLGYRFVTFATGFAETEHPEAEQYLSPFPYMSPFHRLLLDCTPLAPLQPVPMVLDSYGMTRKQTLYVLDQGPRVARWGSPTFTFAHIVSPHPPFVFGKDGEDVSRHELRYYLTDGERFREWYGDRDAYISGYHNQAAFLTERVERMIDQILANSPEPPVIILQSDHGSGLGLSTESLEKTDLHERMSILNAYYLPEKKGDALYQSISPVNSFRVVLNAYFGAGLELLPDRSYYSTWSKPFDFIDVTDRVRLPSDRAAASVCPPGPAQDDE